MTRPLSLVVFARYPVPGAAKTRLIPALGAERAAELQRRMTEHTLRRVAPLRRDGVRVQVRYAGGTRAQMQAWLGDATCCVPQCEGHLGLRLTAAFAERFDAGDAACVIIGSDCPGLDAPIVRTAFDGLRQHDLILGPATDGGYYLIGLRHAALAREWTALFEGIEWGSSRVCAATRDAASRLGISTACLEPLQDVDRPEDLRVWEAFQSRSTG